MSQSSLMYWGINKWKHFNSILQLLFYKMSILTPMIQFKYFNYYTPLCFLFIYFTVLSLTIQHWWYDDWWMINEKQFGRKESWPNWGTNTVFLWGEQGKSFKTSSVMARTQTGNLLNTCLETRMFSCVWIIVFCNYHLLIIFRILHVYSYGNWFLWVFLQYT